MDEIDIKLVEMLQQDGRITNKALARAVNLSESACLERVRKLEASGTIAGYGAIIGVRALGVTFEAWITIRLTEKSTGKTRALGVALSELSFVVAAYELAGSCDVLVHVATRDRDAWEHAEQMLEGAVGPSASIRTAIVVRTLKSQSLPAVRSLLNVYGAS